MISRSGFSAGAMTEPVDPRPCAQARSVRSATDEPAPKSWRQKRKESYLARHGGGPTPRHNTVAAHVAVSAVTFVAKVKRRADASRISRALIANAASTGSPVPQRKVAPTVTFAATTCLPDAVRAGTGGGATPTDVTDPPQHEGLPEVS